MSCQEAQVASWKSMANYIRNTEEWVAVQLCLKALPLATDTTRDVNLKATAEGVKPSRRSEACSQDVLDLKGGIQSGMGYLVGTDLEELHNKARYIRVSPAGAARSLTHDVVEIKTGDKSLIDLCYSLTV